jgi:hypothetical protein
MSPADRSAFKQGDRLLLENLESLVSQGSRIPVRNLTQGKTLETRLEVTPRLARILQAGGLLAYARERLGGR